MVDLLILNFVSELLFFLSTYRPAFTSLRYAQSGLVYFLSEF